MKTWTWTRDGKTVAEGTAEIDIPRAGLGDKIAAIATPIARILGSDCIDPKTKQLKLDSGCAKMKARLNAGMSVSEAMKLRLKGL